MNAVKGGNAVPAISGVTAAPTVALLGTDTPIVFSAPATDADSDSLSYSWQFGDGSTSREPSPTHVYLTAGVFTVRVVVSDGEESAAGETQVNIRALTGSWERIAPPGFGITRLTLTQNGSLISGSVLWVPAPAPPPIITVGQPTECPLVGTLAANSPRVRLEQPPCSLQGVDVPLRAITYVLNPSDDLNTLNGEVITVFPNATWQRQ